jgi:hypothetical protein
MRITPIAGALALAAVLLAAPAGAEPQQQPMPMAEEAAAAAPEAPVSQGTVARAQFALAVIDREPTDAVTRITSENDRVFFFTEVHRFQGQEVVHRWELDGEVKAEVPFGIDGPRWRVYSSKALDPSWLGTWTVSVVDAAGTVVEQQSLDYVATADPVADNDTAPMPPGPAAPAEPIE